MPPGRRRQADDVDAIGKTRNAGDGVLECRRSAACAFADHDGGDGELALRAARRAQVSVWLMAAEIAADHQRQAILSAAIQSSTVRFPSSGTMMPPTPSMNSMSGRGG